MDEQSMEEHVAGVHAKLLVSLQTHMRPMAAYTTEETESHERTAVHRMASVMVNPSAVLVMHETLATTVTSQTFSKLCLERGHSGRTSSDTMKLLLGCRIFFPFYAVRGTISAFYMDCGHLWETQCSLLNVDHDHIMTLVMSESTTGPEGQQRLRSKNTDSSRRPQK